MDIGYLGGVVFSLRSTKALGPVGKGCNKDVFPVGKGCNKDVFKSSFFVSVFEIRVLICILCRTILHT